METPTLLSAAEARALSEGDVAFNRDVDEIMRYIMDDIREVAEDGGTTTDIHRIVYWDWSDTEGDEDADEENIVYLHDLHEYGRKDSPYTDEVVKRLEAAGYSVKSVACNAFFGLIKRNKLVISW